MKLSGLGGEMMVNPDTVVWVSTWIDLVILLSLVPLLVCLIKGANQKDGSD